MQDVQTLRASDVVESYENEPELACLQPHNPLGEWAAVHRLARMCLNRSLITKPFAVNNEFLHSSTEDNR